MALIDACEKSSCLFFLLGAALLLAGCQPAAEKKAAGPPLQRVLFVKPETREVTEFEEFTGRTVATEIVELRARVSGYLEEVLFEDGSLVKKDDLLFRVDDRPFVAEVNRTAASVTQYEVRIKRLANQVKRASDLQKRQAISQDEFEIVSFELEETQATRKSLEASHEIAKLNLQYTQVRAPIGGRIGRRLVDPGNLVTADVTPLATIVPLDQVYVYFDMDERTVLRLRRLKEGGMAQSPMTDEVIIQIALADSDEFTHTGRIDFLDNQIDPATGTLRVRAVVENPAGLLSPGLFVRLRYPIGKPAEALLVPEESLASDQGRPFVYVINDKDVVEARPVELGTQVGPARVIRSGVASADRIAVTGLQRLRRNMKVTPEAKNNETAADKASVAATREEGPSDKRMEKSVSRSD